MAAVDQDSVIALEDGTAGLDSAADERFAKVCAAEFGLEELRPHHPRCLFAVAEGQWSSVPKNSVSISQYSGWCTWNNCC